MWGEEAVISCRRRPTSVCEVVGRQRSKSGRAPWSSWGDLGLDAHLPTVLGFHVSIGHETI